MKVGGSVGLLGANDDMQPLRSIEGAACDGCILKCLFCVSDTSGEGQDTSTTASVGIALELMIWDFGWLRKSVWSQSLRLSMDCLQGAIDVSRDAVNGDNVFASTHVINMGSEAVDRDDVFASAQVIDVGCKAIDGGDVLVNPAPLTTTSLSPVTCSSVPPTFALSSKFHGSLVSPV